MNKSYTQQAVQLSIEGGWYPKPYPNESMEKNTKGAKIGWALQDIEKVLLDPLFWQALAKARGTTTTICKKCGVSITIDEINTLNSRQCHHRPLKETGDPLYHRHRLLCEWIPKGKDIESFFAEIIPQSL